MARPRPRCDHRAFTREFQSREPDNQLSMSTCKPAWATDLKPVGLHYYGGVVECGEEILEKHKIATQSCFGTRTSSKKKTVSGSHTDATDKENVEPSNIKESSKVI